MDSYGFHELTALYCYFIMAPSEGIHLKNQRKHFLIDKPLQFHVMGWTFFILLAVSASVILSLYFGVWSLTLQEFSSENVQNNLQLASRIEDYDAARFNQTAPEESNGPRLAFFKDTEKFSERQREMIDEILEKSHRRLISLLLPLLAFIAVSTIYLSHKIAGPLFRFGKSFEQLGAKDLTIRIRLRKYDEAKTLSTVFNQSIKKLDAALGNIKKILRENRDPSALKNELSKEINEFRTTED